MAESSSDNSYNGVPPPYSEESKVLRQQPLNRPQGRRVHVTQVGVVEFGARSAMTVKCRNCGATVSTTTKIVPGSKTWLMCCLAFCFGCELGCCLFPFCIDSLQDVKHYCPSCNVKLGVYHA